MGAGIKRISWKALYNRRKNKSLSQRNKMKFSIETIIFLILMLGLLALIGIGVYQCEVTKRHGMSLLFEMEKIKMEKK